MTFETSSKIVSGEGQLKNISNLLEDRGFKHPAILCDQNLYESSEYVKTCIADLQEELDLVLFFYDYPFEPSYQFIDKLNQKIQGHPRRKEIDCWVGIGGGSSMDSAKVLAILAKNGGKAIKYKGFPEDLNDPLPVICVPSTTGTGSEVVFNASLIDEDTKIKMGVNYKKNYPVLAILDPKIVSGAPLSVLSSSGCDALVHCLESFVSPVKTNESRMFSTMAFNLIMENMPSLLESKGDIKNWLNMQWAAVFAMYGLSNSSSGPAAALSYYLGTNFKINHGVAGAIFIGKVSRFNHEHGFYDYSDLYNGSEANLSKQERSLHVVDSIEGLLRLADIPESLVELGVKETDLEGFCDFRVEVDAAFKMNPVNIDKSDLMEKILI
tara:strand:+ start:20465 stop:21610 length:1146 start_codon:yes stop_codon:yes gene_type:complete